MEDLNNKPLDQVNGPGDDFINNEASADKPSGAMPSEPGWPSVQALEKLTTLQVDRIIENEP